MAGTGPQIATSPLELLNNRVASEPAFLTKYGLTASCGLMGFLFAVGGNWITRRPLWSGIHRHAIGIVVGTAIGKVYEDSREDHLAERDAIFRHYIELHPEDFPPFERKQYKDLLEPWFPIR